MAKPISGFLSNLGNFYSTEEEANYQDVLVELEHAIENSIYNNTMSKTDIVKLIDQNLDIVFEYCERKMQYDNICISGMSELEEARIGSEIASEKPFKTKRKDKTIID